MSTSMSLSSAASTLSSSSPSPSPSPLSLPSLTPPKSSESAKPIPLPKSGEKHAILSALVGGAMYGVKIRFPHALVMTLLFRRDLSLRDKVRAIMSLTLEHSRNLAAFAAIYKTILAALKWASCYDYKNRPSLSRDGSIATAATKKGMISSMGRAIIRLVFGNEIDVGLSRPNTNSHTTHDTTTNHPAHADPGLPQTPVHSLVAGFIGGYAIWGRYSSINYQIVLYLFSRVSVALLALIREKYARWSLLCAADAANDAASAFSSPLTSSSIITQEQQCQGSRTKKAIHGMRSDEQQVYFERRYRLAAASIWAIVMALFEIRPDSLHPSLKRSMDEIYRFVLPRGLWTDDGHIRGGGGAVAAASATTTTVPGGGKGITSPPPPLGTPSLASVAAASSVARRLESANTIDFSIEDATE